MCIILAKPKNAEFNFDKFSKWLKESAKCNKDGIGYALKRDGENFIYVYKGKNNVEDVLRHINEQNISAQDEFIAHCRIGTSGLIDDNNCHPFVISKKKDDIIVLDGKTSNPVLFHNGMLSKYVETGSDFCDTYHFVDKFLRIQYIKTFLYKEPVLFEETFKEIIGYTKLALLFPSRDMVIINKNNFTEDDGWFFSNNGYKTYATNNSIVRHFHRDYDMDGYNNNDDYYSVSNCMSDRKHSKHYHNVSRSREDICTGSMYIGSYVKTKIITKKASSKQDIPVGVFGYVKSIDYKGRNVKIDDISFDHGQTYNVSMDDIEVMWQPLTNSICEQHLVDESLGIDVSDYVYTLVRKPSINVFGKFSFPIGTKFAINEVEGFNANVNVLAYNEDNSLWEDSGVKEKYTRVELSVFFEWEIFETVNKTLSVENNKDTQVSDTINETT